MIKYSEYESDDLTQRHFAVTGGFLGIYHVLTTFTEDFSDLTGVENDRFIVTQSEFVFGFENAVERGQNNLRVLEVGGEIDEEEVQ